MATLTGTKIKDTYKSLVKVTDNAEAGTSGKQLSDGNGNDLGLFVDTDGVFGIGAAANLSLDISSKTDAVGLPVGTDSNRPTGGAGQIRYNTTDGKLEFYDSAWRHVATESYVNTEITNLIDSAPSTLDTLNELAAALNDDANFATTITNLINGKQSIVTIAVTVVDVGGTNYYFIDGTQQQTITLSAGITYRFDQSDSSNSGHPLQFSTTSNGTHGGGSAYTTGVTVSGTAGSTDAYVQIITEQDTPKLYYYCTNHSGMGGALSHLSDKQDTITGGATTITSSDLTADRALLSNSSGKVAVSDVTATELSYLDGVTSNIQTQINGIGGSQDVFKTIAVAGQSSVVADQTTDTLTLAGASGITITTNDSTDTITFTGSGSGSGGALTVVTEQANGDGTVGPFTLSNTIASKNNVQVYVDGVYQTKDKYSTSGTDLTFGSGNAPLTGTNNIEFVHYVALSGTPAIDVDVFNGDGTTGPFTLTTEPATKNNLQIFIDGVYQNKSNFSTSGTSLTFATGSEPQTGTGNIEVTHIKIS